jgi:hypothetical protein
MPVSETIVIFTLSSEKFLLTVQPGIAHLFTNSSLGACMLDCATMDYFTSVKAWVKNLSFLTAP